MHPESRPARTLKAWCCNSPDAHSGKGASAHQLAAQKPDSLNPRNTFMEKHLEPCLRASLRPALHAYLQLARLQLQAGLAAAGAAPARWLAAALLTGLQLMAPAAWASPFTAADAIKVRTVIAAQLAAFASDDARKAFSFAAPNVREAAGSATGFLAMVRRDYPVVYRPASIAYLKPEGMDDEVLQRVQMLDANGDSWLAVYSLQRQKGNIWRITGCAIVENKGRMA